MWMRKLLVVLVTACLVLVGGAAQAATSNDSCVTGGTTVSTTLFYVQNTNNRVVSNYSWSTNPGALLNRIALELTDNGALYQPASAAGGSTSTLNDVPSSESGYDDNLPITLSGGGYQYRFLIYGGVGNSTDSCSTGWHSF
jgi:hypothetical protein